MRKLIILLILINVVSFGCSSRDIPTPPNLPRTYEPDPDNDNSPPFSDPNEVEYRWDVPGSGGEIV